jgi:hypothetical protein
MCGQCREDLEQQQEEAAMAEFFRKPSHEIEALRQQVAMLTKALERIRTFEPQLVESVLAAVRGERT